MVDVAEVFRRKQRGIDDMVALQQRFDGIHARIGKTDAFVLFIHLVIAHR